LNYEQLAEIVLIQAPKERGSLAPERIPGKEENRPRYRRTLLAFYQVPQALKGVPEEACFRSTEATAPPKNPHPESKPETQDQNPSQKP
jgi:hypothetical protein